MNARDPDDDPTRVLVARAKAGDRAAYDRLFAQTAGRLRLFVRLRLSRRLREKEDTVDLLQETYLAAHQAFGQFEARGDGAFLRWLCRIAETCIWARADHHGARKRVPPAELDRISRVLDEVEAGTTGPVTCAERLEQRRALAAAMAELPQEEREALLMRYFEGLDIEAIAERLGVSPTSARRCLGRAVVRLGARLVPTGEGRT